MVVFIVLIIIIFIIVLAFSKGKKEKDIEIRREDPNGNIVIEHRTETVTGSSPARIVARVIVFTVIGIVVLLVIIGIAVVATGG